MNARSSVLRGGIGILVSIGAILLVLRSVDLDETVAVLREAAPLWLVAMLGSQLADAILRGIRWQRLLAPVAAIPLTRTLDYLLTGYLANNVLPARLGELVRSHYVGDREGVSRTTALGTVVVERVLDTSLLVLIAGAGILVLGVRGTVATAVAVGLAVSALLVAALAVALVAHRLPGSERVIAALAHRRRIVGLATSLRDGLAVVARPRTFAMVAGLSVAAWASSILTLAFGGRALGLELSTAEAALLLAGAALSTAIPSGPGYLGTYELAAVAIGTAIGIPAERAFALAVIVHAAALLVTSLGGLVCFARILRRPTAGPAAATTRSPIVS